MLLGIISIAIFLPIFILVHELGHFLAAKKFGLLVLEFGVGFPPRIWSKKIGETVYSINAIPLGGFVRILGEDGEQEPTREKNHPSKTMASDNSGESVISGRSKRYDERSFANSPAWKRAIVLSSGVFMNFILAWLIASFIFMLGVPAGLFIAEVRADSPASAIGLLPEDRIVSVEVGGKKLEENLSLEAFSQFVKEAAGQEVIIRIERGGGIEDFRAVPRVNPPENQGALGVVLNDAGVPRSGITISFWLGLKTSAEIILAILQTLWGLLVQVLSFRSGALADAINSLAGPVGIVKMSARFGTLGFSYVLRLLDLISLSLVTFNALPLPPLDGGHLLFLLIEKAKGSPLSQNIRKNANVAGIAFLLALMAIITVKDIIGHF